MNAPPQPSGQGEQRVLEQLGEAGLRSLVAAFYRHVRADAQARGPVGILYPPDDWEGAETRLADFLIYRFGGSTRYVAQRGHPRLRARHLAFPIDTAARDRWLVMMAQAMHEEHVPTPAKELLWAFFVSVAEHMRNR